MFRQLLKNLVQNAIDHGGRDVTVRVGDLDGGFYVADNGPGIDRERRGDVFDMGTRPPTGNRTRTLHREANADAHGWDVRIAERAEGGARFEVTGVTVVGD